MRKAILMVAVCATLLRVGTAQATVAPQQKCQQAKLKAQGKLQNCLKKNTAGIIGGKDDVSADCQTKFTNALAKADQKATDAGTSCRYIDSDSATTVTDLNTGLVWEKKDDLAGIHDKDNTYTWSTGSPYNPNGTAFTGLLYGLNGATSSDGSGTVTACFTGHCDWRLPTIQELAAIVDLTAAGCGSGSPCIDAAFGPTLANYYWSATTDSSTSIFGWRLGFYYGASTYFGKANNFYVLAVRGGL